MAKSCSKSPRSLVAPCLPTLGFFQGSIAWGGRAPVQFGHLVRRSLHIRLGSCSCSLAGTEPCHSLCSGDFTSFPGWHLSCYRRSAFCMVFGCLVGMDAGKVGLGLPGAPKKFRASAGMAGCRRDDGRRMQFRSAGSLGKFSIAPRLVTLTAPLIAPLLAKKGTFFKTLNPKP